MKIPTVQKYMSAVPVTIGIDQPMSTAHQLMREHRIRHLPVLAGGRLAGVVSDRDLHLVETLRDVDPEKVAVEDALSPEPYTVGPDAPLDEVVQTMADRKLGSALVVRGTRVVGIFTTTDALHALAELLQRRRAA